MGEMGEVWEELRKEKKIRHRTWHDKNTIELERSGIPFNIASHECYTVRDSVMADFYPSTGRWKDIKSGKCYRGGALEFCLWYYRKKETK